MNYVRERESFDNTADDLIWLANSSLAPGICTMTDARRFHEMLMAERAAWLRRHGRRLPSPAERERELYARPNRREDRRG